jgi:hypothetical protein
MPVIMKKYFVLFLLICITFTVFSQNRKGSFHLKPNSDKHELYVSFYSDDFLNQENALQIAIDKIDGFRQLVTEYSITLEKGITISDNKLDKFASNAAKNNRSSASIYKLKKIYKVQSSNNDNETLYELAGKLELLDEIEYASLVSLTPILPPWDIPPPTPNFEYLQTYLEPDPGVDMRYAWSLGLIGEGIRVRDVEYGFNKDHEALNERNVSVASGMDISPGVPFDWGEHGTAVFGIVIADDADYGMTGMAYGASELILYPEWQSMGYDRIYAVQRSIEDSDEGDVIIFEMQTGGFNGYVPAEFDNVIWDLTKAASDAGIIIVAAAGNGDENLDHYFYSEYMARGNSGAIIVGAGSPDVWHAPLWFTTYGSRVDVQGWGIEVFTSGYGNYMQIGGDINQNYTMFSGTSSATPIVASCVIVLQSYYHSLTGKYMTSIEMRDLLVNTGIPQTGSKHIGPLPNMKEAIEEINNNIPIPCDPPTGIAIETDTTCLVTITWKSPGSAIDIVYNIYKDNILIAENYTDTFYLETIDFEKIFEWCIETVCETGNSNKVCIENEICKLDPVPCDPPTGIAIETDTTCLVTITWENPESATGIAYNIYKDNILIAENYIGTFYLETIDFEKIFEWCIETICETGNSSKICIENEICNLDTVGIKQYKYDTYVLFPNPAYDKLTIKSQILPSPHTKVELLNANGLLISSHAFSDIEVYISLEGLPSGIYFVKISGKDYSISKKIVKI